MTTKKNHLSLVKDEAPSATLVPFIVNGCVSEEMGTIKKVQIAFSYVSRGGATPDEVRFIAAELRRIADEVEEGLEEEEG